MKWLKPYQQKLEALGNDPLAWYFQSAIRRWWFSRWELCVTEWKNDPDLYPRFPRFPIPGLGNSRTREPGGPEGFIPPDPSEDAGEFLKRAFSMIQSDPIVTIKGLSSHQFGFEHISELGQVFEESFDEYKGWAPVAAPIQTGEILCDYRYDYIKVRKCLDRKRRLTALLRLVEEQENSSWSIRFDMLRTYGVLQYIDLRIFELITGEKVSSEARTQLIYGEVGTTAPSHAAVARHRKKALFTTRDLKTSEANAATFLDDESLASIQLENLATEHVLRLWKKTGGTGDGRFLMSAADADIWPD